MTWRAPVGFAVFLVGVGSTSAARANDVQPLVSLPMTIGADHRFGADPSTDFMIGARPELVLAFGGDHGFGIGPYGDAITVHGGTRYLGGGLTAVGYFGGLGVALSGGADQRFADATSHTVPVVGAYFGTRSAEGEIIDNGWPLELPFGARFDVRPGSGGVPASLAIQLQLDVGGAIAFFAYLAKHPDFAH